MAYEKRLWFGGQVGQGNETYEAAVAKYIYENIGQEQYKIIQFHPAYSYEDFVRGITAKAKGESVEYKTENKVLAEFALDALNNLRESEKSSEVISFENWLLNELKLFGEQIQTIIDENSSYPLNENVSIFEVGKDAFGYKGNDWDVPSLQYMKFKDIILEEQNKAQSRKDIISIPKISGRAKSHGGYDFSLLTKFRDYLKTPSTTFVPNNFKVRLKNYVLIIDEINRANLPAVLGELIYALEYRGESVESMYDYEEDRTLILPKNLYIIGTMNTADRSVGHIDYAIRRRFAFVDVLPKKIPELSENGRKLFDIVAKLFCEQFEENDKELKNSKFLAPDFKPTDVMLGHSYFLVKEEDRKNLKKSDDEILKLKLEFEILPLLREYIKDGILKKEAESELKKLISNG